VFELIDLHIKK